jgi:hypothetical protein
MKSVIHRKASHSTATGSKMRRSRHEDQEIMGATESTHHTNVCKYPIDSTAYDQEQPVCTGCFQTQCSRFYGKRGLGDDAHEMYWIKCQTCSKWRDVSNSEQRAIVADELIALPDGHECACQNCMRITDTANAAHKPDLKGPVPCEIIEKAFEDTVRVLLEEFSMRKQVKDGECTQAELDAAITRTRKFFVSRVQSYGDGLYSTSIITKQFRRRKGWWEVDFKAELAANERIEAEERKKPVLAD